MLSLLQRLCECSCARLPSRSVGGAPLSFVLAAAGPWSHCADIQQSALDVGLKLVAILNSL